jgi:acyl-coenzyme A thioesterase PaaI-like protein
MSLTVDSLAPARGTDVVATATALCRGRTLCFCEVEARDADGGLVAKALMTHRYG